MGEFESSLTIQATPDAIFDFVADIGNLPKYLPTTHNAQSQGNDRVRVQGEANEHKYDADGYLRPDAAKKRLEWGADEGYYSGWLQIENVSDTASQVTVHISLRGNPPGSDPNQKPPDGKIQEGLHTALASIQNQVEGQGGKVEPSAAT